MLVAARLQDSPLPEETLGSSARAALPDVSTPYVPPAVGKPASGVLPTPVGHWLSSKSVVLGSSATQS